MKDFFDEIWDEASDFFEDFFEQLGKRPEKKPVKKTAVLNGVEVVVRPAYLFAERVDLLLRIVFGLSIMLSAVTASFLGFATLSELLKELIFTLFGRLLMMIIGCSYLMTAVWRMLHLRQK